MERQRLIKLIESKGTSSKEETNELWDIVRKYPYFQTARMLLAKSFHKQGSIHFHDEMRTAAAYAGDRKVLFHLINDEEAKQKANGESNVFALEQNVQEEKDSFITADIQFLENPFALSTPKEEYIEFYPPKDAADTAIPKPRIDEESPVKQDEKITIGQASPSYSDELSTIQEDIIRRRLNEILSRNKPSPPTPPKAGDSALNEASELNSISEEETKDENVSEKVSMPLPSSGNRGASLEEIAIEPKDEIEGLEIETIIEENFLQELERLPEMGPSTPQTEEGVLNEVPELNSNAEIIIDQSVSFIDWLKQINHGRTTVEEVKDEPILDSSKMITPPLGGGEAAALIDKFIETAPRIVPSKAEFYSPSNMARLSIIDNEDVFSETLARIYFDQGNYQKARFCYEKLSLLYPEKSASFAPLIQKIDDLIRNQT